MSREDWRRRMRIVRRKFGAALLPIAAPTTLRMLSHSWKLERIGQENFDATMRESGRLVTFWHGRMLLPLRAHQNTDVSVLVSPSDDGSLVTALLGRFGYRTIRGSSNKNPARAIRRMLTRLEEGGTIVVTPDGPRGPRHSVNPGPAWMARATGFSILPMGFGYDHAWCLNSWDHFTIPKRGARVVIVYGEPIRLAASADDDAIASATELMRERMLDAERRAFAHLGVRPDW